MALGVIFAGDEWRGRVGSSWAAEWVRTDRSFSGLTGQLVDAVEAAIGPVVDKCRRSVLDIGCGAGETALRLAARRPDLDVVGLDLSEALVVVARERGAGQANLSFAAGDASAWSDHEPFDGALSRHGVMFFDDPASAFTHLHSLMRPDAPLCFTCFAAREDNEWAQGVAALVDAPAPADPYAPGPFAFADADHVHAILAEAGWRDASAERIVFRYVAGAGPDPVADALDFFARIGPAARAIAALDADAAEALKPRLTRWIETHLEGGEVSFPASVWLWRARA